MRIGDVSLCGSEGQLLVRVALVDACLDLNDKIQDWKATTDELWEDTDEQYFEHHDRVITRCINKLAKLIGLLQLGGMTLEQL